MANNYVVRITSFEVVIIRIILIAFCDEYWAKWESTATLIDFGLRTTVGASMSPTKMIGVVIAAPYEPQLVAGPGKQWHLCCVHVLHA